MAVGPSHRGLDCQVQTVEPQREGNLDAPPDFGLYIVERDLEAGNRIDGHAAILHGLDAAAQFHGSRSSILLMG